MVCSLALDYTKELRVCDHVFSLEQTVDQGHGFAFVEAMNVVKLSEIWRTSFESAVYSQLSQSARICKFCNVDKTRILLHSFWLT